MWTRPNMAALWLPKAMPVRQMVQQQLWNDWDRHLGYFYKHFKDKEQVKAIMFKQVDVQISVHDSRWKFRIANLLYCKYVSNWNKANQTNKKGHEIQLYACPLVANN